VHKLKNYFSRAEVALWASSVILITASFLIFDRESVLALVASLIGVLIVLWVLASLSDVRYVSVAACFIAFLANDIYGYASWQKMKLRQSGDSE